LRIARSRPTGRWLDLVLLGLKPDIAVDVTSEEERAYYADSFVVLPKYDLVASAISPSPTRRLPQIVPRVGSVERGGIGAGAADAVPAT